MHKTKLNFLGVLVFPAILFVLLFLLSSRYSAPDVYMEPVLSDPSAEIVSVIVTGQELETAVAAVTQAGGQITSKLWLIDAVAATLDAQHLDKVAGYPGILSIVENKRVQVSTIFTGTSSWESWVTERRYYRYNHALAAPLSVPLLALPDGGAFIINESGNVVILNEDGSLRSRLNLHQNPPSPFRKAAVVSQTGIVYIANERRAFAIDTANGSLLWSVNAPQKFSGDVALSSSHLIVTDKKNKVYALNLSDGSQLWAYTQSNSAGKFSAPPTVAPDDTIYLLSDKGVLTALDPTGGSALWTYQASIQGKPYEHPPQFDANGSIYFFGYKGRVYRIAADGHLHYEVNLTDKIWAQAVVANNGTFYAGTENGNVVGINVHGDIVLNQIVPDGGHIYTAPALAADGRTLFVAVKEGKLLAYDTETGSLNWSYNTSGDLLADPILAANGNLHIGDKNGRYQIFHPTIGLVLYNAPQFNEFVTSPAISKNGSVFLHDTDMGIVVFNRFPLDWHDQLPYAEPTNDPTVYKVADPISIDLGADVAHNNGVTGSGVTVAVVDSGVHFNPAVQAAMGISTHHQFLGQADFVGALNCTDTMAVNEGIPSSCFSDYTNSHDGYGHGSHVAGIIWNNLRDYYTGVTLGIAPQANVLSIRVLDDTGMGTYVDLIEGIQYVVAHADAFNIRVMNLSLSGQATTPYFVDPLNRAVEEAWAHGIVVVAAAGNSGAAAETITVPGNDPYVITVGSLNSQRTAGYWGDDALSSWSSTGPTLDGFIKPDILVPGSNVVSYMYNDPYTSTHSAYLVQTHPDYSADTSMFRMNGTSMATAVASGLISLLLDAHPTLTPDQVKFRLLYTARTAQLNGELVYSPLQQGMGRIWVPDIIFDQTVPSENANASMDIVQDLAHPWTSGDDPDPANNSDLAYHYEGPVQRLLSDDGTVILYYVEDVNNGNMISLGASMASNGQWLDSNTLFTLDPTFNDGQISWSSGGYLWSGGGYLWSGGGYLWSGGGYLWSGGGYLWSGGGYLWSGSGSLWSGRYIWSDSNVWHAGIDPNSTQVGVNSLADFTNNANIHLSR